MLTETAMAFIESNASGAMVTVGDDGRPKIARVSVGVVDGQVLSSGTADRVRTRRLRRDPRCTLMVFGAKGHWLGLETTVTIIDDETAAGLNLRLARAIQQRPTGPLWWLGDQELDDDAFIAEMVRDHRLVYRFTIDRCYGEI